MLPELIGHPCSHLNPGTLRSQVADIGQRMRAASPEQVRLAIDDAEVALPMEVVAGVARIRIEGLLVPSGAALLRWFGIRATDYQEITAMVSSAARDPNARALLLEIDSQGGFVRGISSAVDAIYSARKRKPVHAHCTGMMASCAYHLGSQAERVTADRNAMVGSIGEMIVLVDSSKALRDEGIEVVVIASGKHKGAGVYGAEITTEQRAAFREMVNDGFELFIRDVLRGREDLSRKELLEVADGRSFYAERAQRFKLIDAVETSPRIQAPERAPQGDDMVLTAEQRRSYELVAKTLDISVEEVIALKNARGQMSDRDRARTSVAGNEEMAEELGISGDELELMDSIVGFGLDNKGRRVAHFADGRVELVSKIAANTNR